MSSPARVAPTLLLVFLLGASILAVQPVQSLPVSGDQQLNTEATFGEGAPFSAWETRIETNRQYLQSDSTADLQTCPVPDACVGGFSDGTPPGAHLSMTRPLGELEGSPCSDPTMTGFIGIGDGEPCTQAEAFATPDSDDKQALIATEKASVPFVGGEPNPASPAARVADFPMAPVLDDVRLYKLDYVIYAACHASSLDPLAPDVSGLSAIQATLWEQAQDASGNWVNQGDNPIDRDVKLVPDAGGMGPDFIQPYVRTRDIGNPTIGTGLLIEAGHRLHLHLAAADIGGNSAPGAAPDVACFIHYASTAFPSRLQTNDDGARLAVFATDDEDERVTGFPAGDSTNSANRRAYVQVVQASPWPDAAAALLDLSLKRVNTRLFDLAGQEYLYYVDNLDGNQNPTLEMDVHVIERISRTDATIGESLVRRTFEYAYDEAITEARIRPEVYSFWPNANNLQYSIFGEEFRIGGKGIDIALLPGEKATHLVNRNEPTQFAFLLKNTGTEDDLVSVSSGELTGGWKAEVQGGGQVFLAAGKSATVVLEVTPPPGAVPPASMAIPVRASSSFNDVPDPAVITVRTTLTDSVVRDVELTSPSSLLQVRPGVTKALALTLHNNGTSAQNFVLLPSVPSNVAGWTIKVDPTSVQVVAGGSMQVQVAVTPPREASGTSFPLGITAVLVGDSAVSDRVDLTVRVFPVEGVLASLLDPLTNRTLRGAAPGTCIDGNAFTCIVADGAGGDPSGFLGRSVDDTDFDNTGLFRVAVENLGDADDAFKVEAFWDAGAPDTDDDPFCHVSEFDPTTFIFEIDGPDGVPDGWRFNGPSTLGESLPDDPQRGQGARDGFSGVMTLTDTSSAFAVSARSTANYLVEVGYLSPDACPDNKLTGLENSLPSPTAHLVLTFTSVNEPTRKTIVTLRGAADDAGEFRGQNEYSGGVHDVGLEPSLGEQTAKAGALGTPIAYNLVAYNSGNEFDDLDIVLNSPPSGWTHKLEVVGSVPPGIVACDPVSSSGLSVRCPRVGVFDEIHFKGIATPDRFVPVGQRDTMTVRVVSGDAPTVDEVLTVVSRAAGTFGFEVVPNGLATRSVAPGVTTPLPFVIQNLGTEADTFRASTVVEDDAWNAVLSTGAGVFAPAGNDVAAYLSVTPPANAPLGVPEHFRIAVDSLGGLQRQVIDLFATPTAPGRLTITSLNGTDVLLPTRGAANNVEVRVVLTSGSETPVRLEADDLPPGWTVSPESKTLSMSTVSGGRPTATTSFQVTPPADALATSRAVLRIVGSDATGNEPSLRGTMDVVLNLASTFGIELGSTNVTLMNQTIPAGGEALYDVEVRNLGLAPDTVRFTHTTLPSGWTMLVNPGSMTLGPLEARNVTVKLGAPVSAEPKSLASVLLFATSVSDPTSLDSIALAAQIGFNELKAEFLGPEPYGAPQETLVYVFNVTNTGSLPDRVHSGGALESSSLVRFISGNFTPGQFDIDPGQTVQVRIDQTLDHDIPSNISLPATAVFTSLLDERVPPAKAEAKIAGHVLPYAVNDVNGDGLSDYAVDRDRDATNGFEQFRRNLESGGNPLGVPDLQRFLRDDARESMSVDVTLDNGTVVRALDYTIDGDNDGKVDHFLDTDGDDLPDIYWDPDANQGSPIEFRKDVNGDQVPETFVDTDGDGSLDAVFDLTRGTFTNVIQTDVDGDGRLDYVVDKDGDGQVDQDETVLYTRTGALLIVQKVDVDGDGRLDQVFDTDGDGNPDYFIPAGSTQAVPIVMRDVNGDGVMDWTFDGDNDGRNESYYDPATGEAHVINAAGHFVDALKEYWYIGALFALVVVLFVALVLVTRR